MKLYLVAAPLLALVLSCGGDSAPEPTATAVPPTATPTPTPTPTPDPVEDEIDEAVSDILSAMSIATRINLWAAQARTSDDAPSVDLLDICADVPASGFQGLVFESIWPAEYVEVDLKLRGICATAAETYSPDIAQDREVWAAVIQRTLEPAIDVVIRDEVFDIRNKLRERADDRARANE